DLRDAALEQQGVAEILVIRLESGARCCIALVLLQDLQRAIGDKTAADALLAELEQIGDADDLLVEGAGGDEAEHPGHLDGIADLASGGVRQADKRETR